MTELRFGADGFLDMSALPDGDPDTVLSPDDLTALHEVLVASRPDVDGAEWDALVRAVVTDEIDAGPPPVDLPGDDGSGDQGPFDAGTWSPPDLHDGGEQPAVAPGDGDDHHGGHEPDPDHGDAMAAAMGGVHHDTADPASGGHLDDLVDPWTLDDPTADHPDHDDHADHHDDLDV